MPADDALVGSHDALTPNRTFNRSTVLRHLGVVGLQTVF
jgi:hypothetical protein